MGLLISFGVVGAQFYNTLSDKLRGVTYHVTVNDESRLRRIYDDQRKREVLDKEPLTSWGRRFMAGFQGILPLAGQM